MRNLTRLLVLLIVGGIWSCSDDPVGDITPPADITDLRVSPDGSDWVLAWTAPADDGLEGDRVRKYDIRIALDDVVAKWDSATVIRFRWFPVAPGDTQYVPVDSLGEGTWQFAVRSGDEVPNWSGLSNPAFASVLPDTIAPATITDLQAEVLSATVSLTWTAPGDDGLTGRASAYDLRYSPGPITEENWEDATSRAGVAAPQPSGSLESLMITDLDIGQTYYVVLRAIDEVQNESAISNVVEIVISAAQPRQLTFHTGENVRSPNWSNGGDRIAYTADAHIVNIGDRPAVFVVPVSGGPPPERYTFTSPEGVAGSAWSPDDSEFAVIAKEPRGKSRVNVLSTMDAVPHGAIRKLIDYGTGSKSVGFFTWSPDGSTIAYKVFDFVPGAFANDLYTIPATGGEPTHIFHSVDFPGAVEWSPDGTKFLFSSDREGSFDIWTLPVTGGSPTRITNDPEDNLKPVWSPDGSTIAYISGGKLWRIPSSGGAREELVNDGNLAVESAIDWSPDGKSIVYVKVTNGVRNVWVARIN